MKGSRIFAPVCFIALIASTGGIATAALAAVSFASLLDEKG